MGKQDKREQGTDTERQEKHLAIKGSKREKRRVNVERGRGG